MILAYIAAPYAGDLAVNLVRAEALAVAVMRLGRVPVVPHYVVGAGQEETPESREAALRACLSLLERVARLGGELHVLLRDDGTLSAGCAMEVEWWRGLGAAPVLWRWSDAGPVRV